MPLAVREDQGGATGAELDGVSVHADVDIEQAVHQLQGKVISLEQKIFICWRKLEYLGSLVLVKICRILYSALNYIGEYDNIDNSIK